MTAVPPLAPNRARRHRDGPVRSCIGCRRRFAKDSLVRLTVAGQQVVVDADGRAPGRGGYICSDEQCLDRVLASEGRLLRRALRTGPRSATVDPPALRRAWRAARRLPEDEARQADEGGQAAGWSG